MFNISLPPMPTVTTPSLSADDLSTQPASTTPTNDLVDQYQATQNQEEQIMAMYQSLIQLKFQYAAALEAGDTAHMAACDAQAAEINQQLARLQAGTA